MAKVRVKVVDSVVDGATDGDIIEIDAKSAQYLSGIGYVEILVEKSPVKAAESAPKPKATATRARKGKE